MTRRQVRWLTAHATVVGIAWFAVGLPVAVYLSGRSGPAMSIWRTVPPVLQGGIAVSVAVVALPLLWPVWLAIGWAEGSWAEQAAAGDTRAPGRAVRIVSAQAVGWFLVAAALGLFALRENHNLVSAGRP